MEVYSDFNDLYTAFNNKSTHFVFNEVKAVSGNVPLDFDSFYKGSWYTITGAGDDLEDWVGGYDMLLSEAGIGKPAGYVTFNGADMNKEYGLSGSVAYPDDLTFIAFPLDDLDVGKLAMFKLKMGDRWFDDIVDNNRRHMEE